MLRKDSKKEPFEIKAPEPFEIKINELLSKKVLDGKEAQEIFALSIQARIATAYIAAIQKDKEEGAFQKSDVSLNYLSSPNTIKSVNPSGLIKLHEDIQALEALLKNKQAQKIAVTTPTIINDQLEPMRERLNQTKKEMKENIQKVSIAISATLASRAITSEEGKHFLAMATMMTQFYFANQKELPKPEFQVQLKLMIENIYSKILGSQQEIDSKLEEIFKEKLDTKQLFTLLNAVTYAFKNLDFLPLTKSPTAAVQHLQNVMSKLNERNDIVDQLTKEEGVRVEALKGLQQKGMPTTLLEGELQSIKDHKQKILESAAKVIAPTIRASMNSDPKYDFKEQKADLDQNNFLALVSDARTMLASMRTPDQKMTNTTTTKILSQLPMTEGLLSSEVRAKKRAELGLHSPAPPPPTIVTPAIVTGREARSNAVIGDLGREGRSNATAGESTSTEQTQGERQETRPRGLGR